MLHNRDLQLKLKQKKIVVLLILELLLILLWEVHSTSHQQLMKRTHLSWSKLQSSSFGLFSWAVMRISHSCFCEEHSHELRAEITLSLLEYIEKISLFPAKKKSIHTPAEMCAGLNRLFTHSRDHYHYILYSKICIFQLCRSIDWFVRG